ncbi:uncharacterized protein [Diadema antillarum]|uniref:uncharacterized protein n=1 Tax=Diadema antillarum TaxID=105358 RepID=UPI003A8701BB
MYVPGGKESNVLVPILEFFEHPSNLRSRNRPATKGTRVSVDDVVPRVHLCLMLLNFSIWAAFGVVVLEPARLVILCNHRSFNAMTISAVIVIYTPERNLHLRGTTPVTAMGKNIMLMCLVAVLLDHYSGQDMTTRTTPGPASCDTKCTYSEGTREADCNYRQLSEVPMECNAASHLSLSHNQIERVEPGTFEGFSDLQVLVLSNNRIRQVEANTFAGASKLRTINLQSNNLELFHQLALNGSNSDLREIYLGHNMIAKIETDTFQFVIKLEFIALNNNNLSSLGPGVFDNLRHLEVLDLAYNKLKILSSDIFAHLRRLQTIILSDNQLVSAGRVLILPRITTLDLHNNNLSRLENVMEQTLGRLQVLFLEGNPWNCDCHLEALRLWYMWLHSQGDHGVYVDSPVCHEPPSLAKQPINGGHEGFCPKSDFSSTTDAPKSTKGSSDEINNITLPYTGEPNSPGNNNVKVIVIITFIFFTVMVVCISCVLKYKCSQNCLQNWRSNCKRRDKSQSKPPADITSDPKEQTYEDTEEIDPLNCSKGT